MLTGVHPRKEKFKYRAVAGRGVGGGVWQLRVQHRYAVPGSSAEDEGKKQQLQQQ